MAKLPSSIQRLINELSRLPGIGPKTAQRLAFYLLKKDSIDINNLSLAISQVKNGVTFCSVCHIMAETDPCGIDADPKRDHDVICVVEESLDALAIDKTGQFNGVFHVLGGVLNPLEGTGPEQLTINHLMQRVRQEEVKEIIIATNPSLEGETTAMHLAKLIKGVNQEIIKSGNQEIKVSRIARGLPMGGDLEYADDITLMRALEGRREY
ncbi:MAG: recombination mediator RecR [Patescibacteria group bacterium]|nr:recombination mediator RecR [Patescibacteria group bacterium]